MGVRKGEPPKVEEPAGCPALFTKFYEISRLKRRIYKRLKE